MLFVCYMVVVFTIAVQRLTIERAIGLLFPRETAVGRMTIPACHVPSATCGLLAGWAVHA
jgi:hypothetical protein